ncbi:hypothetical protein J3Q64DRAFT_1826706 [Phycomyces blakesleeanus]|uniref:F-box domain-containing protein n=1 Tax=Phycomyces blakesleeanus TaxID=4837 RepID=A0ABR3AH66_PHYBL
MVIFMRSLELPFEILTQIADDLSTKDRLYCALTCKTWRYPFQSSLWKKIRFYSPDDVQTLINIVKASQNVQTPHGSCVHSLRIGCHYNATEISDINFSGLFRYLPNMKSLHLENISYDDIDTDITRSDKIWKSLENLKIHYKGTRQKKSAKPLFELINACVILQKLEISAGCNGYRMKFSVDDFESMHQHLQDLSAIKVDIYLSPDFSAILDNIPDITLAFSVTSVEINSKEYKYVDEYGSASRNNWNPLWLYYFSLKYPNLRSLKLNITDTCSTPINSDERQALITLFHSNPNAFQHLETFDLKTDRYFEHSDFILWELFCALKTPLKHLKLDTTKYGQVDPSYPMNVNRILQSFSGTLESLSVKGFIYNYTNENTILELSSYNPLLTDLCISGSNMSLNLNDILDNFVSLKQLKIDGGTFLSNPYTTNGESNQREQQEQKQKQHELQILTLKNCAVTAEIFNILSFRCRKLKHITLDTVVINGYICKKTGCLLLDMSHIFLKTLRIGQNEREKKKINSEYPTVTSHAIDWIYAYEYFGKYGESYIQTTKLSDKGANIALEYYQNFQSNKTSQTLEDYSSYDNEDPDMDRKCELYKGYTELRFGKIEAVHVIRILYRDLY